MAQPSIPAIARALWYTAPGTVELREERSAVPGPNEVLVATSFSGVSRGTERLIMAGRVGRSEWERMRAPMQAGVFPYPVKYGYCATGTIIAGEKSLIGRSVFALHPHQDYFVAAMDQVTLLPPDLPVRRATLAANMETALNAVWDSAAGPADRIVVVGGGIVGLLVGYLAARLPGADVTLVDVAPERQMIANLLGLRFVAVPAASSGTVAPGETTSGLKDADVVFHTSASATGLAMAIDAAGFEATVVELSWYGAGAVAAPLGGAFHSRRIKLISSQVGHVSASRRARWDYRRRLESALKLLQDPRLDQLITEEIDFNDAPTLLPRLLAPGATGLAPVIRYPNP
jgi:threonine dehydrogenase-like Zn-dependent dehydrogenase